MSESKPNYQVTLITVGATIVVALISGAFAIQSSAKQAAAGRVAACQAEFVKRDEQIRAKGAEFLSGVAEVFLKIEPEKPIPVSELRAPLLKTAFALAAYADADLAKQSIAVSTAFDDVWAAIKAKRPMEPELEKAKAAMQDWQPIYQRQFTRLKAAREICTE